MKVTLHTPRQLVVHDGAAQMAVMGAVFLAFGGGAITLLVKESAGLAHAGSVLVLGLAGGVFSLVGVVILSLAADRRYVIDLDDGAVRMVVQRLGHRSVTLHALSDLDDVALERSRSLDQSQGQRQGPTYRIVFLTRAGKRIPWTPYSTGDEASLAACAAEVRSFCGWSSHPLPAPPARWPVLLPFTHGAHAARTNWGGVAAFLALFVAIGLGLFATEAHRLLAWQPTPAQVVSTGIETVRGKGTTYAPVVVYEYTFDGRPYRSNGVLPLGRSASVAWAAEIRDRFRPGQIVTAYVDPTEPSHGFLVRELSLVPLLFVAMPLGFAGLLVWSTRATRRLLVAGQDVPPVPIVEA
jgi:hypothetical protein